MTEEVGLFTTEYGLLEIARNQLFGADGPTPVQYAEVQKQMRRYQSQHPGLVVARDDRSARNGGIVLVWMPQKMFSEYQSRMRANRSYTVRQYYADLEAAQAELPEGRRELEP